MSPWSGWTDGGGGAADPARAAAALTDGSVVAKISGLTLAISAELSDCAEGDADACRFAAFSLADSCDFGEGKGCDVLFAVAEVGSLLEAHGATCGQRFGRQYAGSCSEILD
jgi:hypothetical protein